MRELTQSVEHSGAAVGCTRCGCGTRKWGVCADEEAGVDDCGETKKTRKEQVALFLAGLAARRARGVEEERKNLRAGNRRDTGEELVESLSWAVETGVA